MARSVALDWLAHNELPGVSQMIYNRSPRPTWWLPYFYAGGAIALASTGVLLSEAFVSAPAPAAAALQFILSVFVAEIPLNIGLHWLHHQKEAEPATPRRTPLTKVLVNYNLKAHGVTEIETCFQNATAVLELCDVHLCIVSTTTDTMLRSMEKSLASTMKQKYKEHFHYLYRRSTVLRKCGNYQDLIAFCGGSNDADTLFNYDASTPNIRHLQSLNMQYTLVMDSDNVITKDSLRALVETAEREFEYCIFQPRIQLINERTFYQHIQATIHNLHIHSICGVFDAFRHAPFFGKGLIRNVPYFEKVIEPCKIPTFALSHDTIESALLPTYFVGHASLYESVPRSHVDWSIREERWNAGDIIACVYLLHPRRALENRFQRLFFATAATRVLVCRPILLAFLLLGLERDSAGTLAALVFCFTTVLLTTLVALLATNAQHKLYTSRRVIAAFACAQIFHATEPITGSMRLLRSLWRAGSVITNTPTTHWIPSSLIEERIREMGDFKSALNEFWLSSVLALVVLYHFHGSVGACIFAGATLVLPFTTWVTTYTKYPALVCTELGDELRV